MKKPISSKNKKRLKAIGELVKELRIKDGYTDRGYFCFEHKLTLNTVQRIETGQESNLTSLFQVIDALNLSISDFFAKLDKSTKGQP